MTLNPAKDPTCVAAYDWGEGAGSVLYDLSQYSNNGTIYGATRTRGILRYAGSFDGLDDYVEVPDSASLYTYTAMAWVAPKGVPPNYQAFIWDADHQLRLAGDGINRFQTWIYSGTSWWSPGYYVYSTENYPNNWYFVAYQYDDTENVGRLFVGHDGELELIGERNGAQASPLSVAYIGQSTAGHHQYNGLIGSVRIYNRALSKKEILEHYYYGIKVFAQPDMFYHRKIAVRV